MSSSVVFPGNENPKQGYEPGDIQSRLSIEDFKANLANGGVRPTMFEATIYVPNSVTGDSPQSEVAQRLTFLCKAATLPGSQIGVIDVPFRGRKLKVSGDRTFADWSTTIINDTSMETRATIEKWAEFIQNHNYALGANFLGKSNARGTSTEGYFGTGYVRQLDRQGNQLRIYEFNGIWPSTISDIQLDFGVNDTIEEYDVNFCVQYWHAAGRQAEDVGTRINTYADPNDNPGLVIT